MTTIDEVPTNLPDSSGGAYSTPAFEDRPVDPHDGDPGLINLVLFVAAVIALGLLVSWWVVAAVGLLALMLFMHELGHYLTARASGMKVTEFFLGFGPRIWSFRKGETEYGIKAIWAGAYVRIAGLNSIEDVHPSEEHRTYRAKSYPKRMWVITAGSAMHFLMAFIGLFLMFNIVGSYGTTDPEPDDWVVDQVVAGTAAERMGLQPGDDIVEINGAPIASFDDLAAAVGPLAARTADIVVDRNGQRVALSGELGVNSGDVVNDAFGLTLLSPVGSEPWQVGSVQPGSNAATFGFATGDLLTAIDSQPIRDRPDLAAALFAADGTEVQVEVERRGEATTLTGDVVLADEPVRGFLGIGPGLAQAPRDGIVTSLGRSAESFGVIAKESLAVFNPRTWAGLFTDQSTDQVATSAGNSAAVEGSGGGGGRPVSAIGAGRVWVDAESAEQRIFIFVLVNIAIGILNLAPLLPLDGGHALIATYERGREFVTRRPHRVDAEKLVPLTWAVILVLMVVGVWSIALDIFAWPPV